jgi:ribonuclease HI
VAKRSVYNDVATNNYAEYRAIVLALEWCIGNLDLQHAEVTLYSDSELVIKQINGEYKVKSDKLIEMNCEVKSLEQKFHKLAFRHARRDDAGITAVDEQLNALLDRLLKGKKSINI